MRHAPAPVTDENVEAALEQMREHHAELRSVERPAAPGDVVIVDYTLSPEGLPSNSESGYAFQVGEGSVLPEIDQAVVGVRAGEEREVGVRFSAEHRREELRDKPGRAAVKVVEVKEKVLPALDDDFAKQVGSSTPWTPCAPSCAASSRRGEIATTSSPWRARSSRPCSRATSFPCPRPWSCAGCSTTWSTREQRLRRQGIDPDTVPWDYQKLVADLRQGRRGGAAHLAPRSHRRGRARGAQETEVDAEIEKLAAASRRPAAAVRRMMDKGGELEALRSGLREQQTLDLLIRHATVHPEGTPSDAGTRR